MNPALFLLLMRAGSVAIVVIDPPYSVVATQVHFANTAAGELYQPGAAEAQPFFPGTVAGQVSS